MVSQALGVLRNLTGPAVSSRVFYNAWHKTRTPVAVHPGGTVVPMHSTPRPSTSDTRAMEAIAAGRRVQAAADAKRAQETS
jgi:hypothetical protein